MLDRMALLGSESVKYDPKLSFIMVDGTLFIIFDGTLVEVLPYPYPSCTFSKPFKKISTHAKALKKAVPSPGLRGMSS